MTDWNPGITPAEFIAAAQLWYPIITAEELEELTESEAAAQLGLTVEEYQVQKQAAVDSLNELLVETPNGLYPAVELLRERPELFEQ